MLRSHLARGAWIEIVPCYMAEPGTLGRTSQEVRGLKLNRFSPSSFQHRRTSQEVRGLKFPFCFLPIRPLASHLARGAWIEIAARVKVVVAPSSHLARGAWIEIV